jgi:triosephosphate isomerase (TIM)
MNHRYIVANWKMYLSYFQVEHWIAQYGEPLGTITGSHPTVSLIICPSFESLSLVGRHFRTSISLGAQDSSQHSPGAFTGSVSALSLAQLGCTYCIIGHSERRRDCQETNLAIAQKAVQLLQQEIIPIICIGENQGEREAGYAKKIVEEQVISIINSLMMVKPSKLPLFIAYEPIWAIGTGITPQPEELSEMMKFISSLLAHYPLPGYKILYGGSVDAASVQPLLNLPLDGFLIGKASTNFQELKKIVSLIEESDSNLTL